MTVIWLVIEVMFLFLFYQLPSAVEPVEHKGTDNGTGYQEQSTKLDNASVSIDESDSYKGGHEKRTYKGGTSVQIDSTTGEEYTPLLSAQPNTKYSINTDFKKQPQSTSEGANHREMTGGDSENGKLLRGCSYVVFVASQMIREEIVVLLAVIFLTVFSQTALEVCTQSSHMMSKHACM